MFRPLKVLWALAASLGTSVVFLAEAEADLAVFEIRERSDSSSSIFACRASIMAMFSLWSSAGIAATCCCRRCISSRNVAMTACVFDASCCMESSPVSISAIPDFVRFLSRNSISTGSLILHLCLKKSHQIILCRLLLHIARGISQHNAQRLIVHLPKDVLNIPSCRSSYLPNDPKEAMRPFVLGL